jgi:urease accessory protein
MRRLLVPAFVAFASPAFAHPSPGHAAGVIYGFSHPLGGLDHVLAMVGVGLFAALLGGRALWAVPLSFVAMMAVGGALGMAGAHLPVVEAGVGLSVFAIGAMVALQWRFPLAIAAALAGLFAVFHGYAHGVEMPVSASGIRYGAGFVFASALLHCAGVGLGLALGLLGDRHKARFAQAGGGAMAVAGIAMLSAMISH